MVSSVSNLSLVPATTYDILAKDPSFGSKVSLCARQTLDSFKNLLGKADSSFKTLKFACIAAVPFAIGSTVRAIRSFKGASTSEKIDASLQIVSATGVVVGVTSSIAEGLVGVGKVAAKEIIWATPLAIVGAALGCADIALSAKHLIEGYKFSKAFHRAVGDSSPENYKEVVELIKYNQESKKSFIRKYLGVDAVKLIGNLEKIEEEGDSAKMKSAIKMLADRLTFERKSQALSLLTSVVSVIAFGLLFSPAAPLGFALLALSTVSSVSNLVMKTFSTKDFKDKLQEMSITSS